MSASANRALLDEGIAAYNRGDLGFLFTSAADDIEVYSDPALVNSGAHRGREAFERWMREWQEAWRNFTIDVRAVEEIDGRFLMVDVLQRGVGSGSGIEVEMELVQLVELRDGEIARLHLYPDREKAQAALATLRAAPERGLASD